MIEVSSKRLLCLPCLHFKDVKEVLLADECEKSPQNVIFELLPMNAVGGQTICPNEAWDRVKLLHKVSDGLGGVLEVVQRSPDPSI